MLTNVIEQDNSLKWRMNLKSLISNFEQHISQFPTIPSGVKYDGPTFFISGGNSDYVQDEDKPKILELFPSTEFRVIEGAGHWVHAEKPKEFIQVFLELLDTTEKLE